MFPTTSIFNTLPTTLPTTTPIPLKMDVELQNFHIFQGAKWGTNISPNQLTAQITLPHG